MRKTEFSKKILFWVTIIFCGILISSLLFAWNSKDTSIFVYSIPTTGGVFGSAVVFYLNKSKMENVCKGKIEFLKFKMKEIEKHPNLKNEIEEELSIIDETLNDKINSEITNSISEDITLQNY